MLSYLASYQGMGVASVECVGGCECQSVEVDSLWVEHASMLMTQELKVGAASRCRRWRVEYWCPPAFAASRSGGKHGQEVGVSLGRPALPCLPCSNQPGVNATVNATCRPARRPRSTRRAGSASRCAAGLAAGATSSSWRGSWCCRQAHTSFPPAIGWMWWCHSCLKKYDDVLIVLLLILRRQRPFWRRLLLRGFVLLISLYHSAAFDAVMQPCLLDCKLMHIIIY